MQGRKVGLSACRGPGCRRESRAKNQFDLFGTERKKRRFRSTRLDQRKIGRRRNTLSTDDEANLQVSTNERDRCQKRCDGERGERLSRSGDERGYRVQRDRGWRRDEIVRRR